jgi:hypothetical protein
MHMVKNAQTGPQTGESIQRQTRSKSDKTPDRKTATQADHVQNRKAWSGFRVRLHTPFVPVLTIRRSTNLLWLGDARIRDLQTSALGHRSGDRVIGSTVLAYSMSRGLERHELTGVLGGESSINTKTNICVTMPDFANFVGAIFLAVI